MFASSSPTDKPDVFVCHNDDLFIRQVYYVYIVQAMHACIHIYTMQMVHIPCCTHAV